MTNANAIVSVTMEIFNENIVEIQPNLGFTCKGDTQSGSQYQAEMELVGWDTHDEWCAYAAILNWKLGYTHNNHQDVWKYFSRIADGNAQQMARKAHADKFWPTGIVPRLGCMVVWGLGDSASKGHVGICVDIDPDGVHFTTVEGNSVPQGNPGNEAEGYTNAKHIHALGQPHSVNGLNFVRCLYVVEELPS